MMSRLQKISEEYNVAVFITNQMTADPGASLSFQVKEQKLVLICSTYNVAHKITVITDLKTDY